MTTVSINASDTASIRRDEDTVTSFYKIGSTNSPYDEWYYRGLLYFNLSTVPAGASITGARIECYLKDNLGSNSGTYSAHRVLQSWTGAYVTRSARTSSESWSVVGGSFEADTSAATWILDASESTGWKQWYFKPLGLTNLQAMIKGTMANYGWLLKNSENANRAHGFDKTGNVPKLIVEYRIDLPRAVTMFF